MLKDKKISILKLYTIEDDEGFEEKVYKPIPGGKDIWAYYRQASGKEFYAAKTINTRVEAIFIINWKTNIRPGMEPELFIDFRGDIFNVSYIDDFEGYKKDLKIYAYKRSGEDN